MILTPAPLNSTTVGYIEVAVELEGYTQDALSLAVQVLLRPLLLAACPGSLRERRALPRLVGFAGVVVAL